MPDSCNSVQEVCVAGFILKSPLQMRTPRFGEVKGPVQTQNPGREGTSRAPAPGTLLTCELKLLKICITGD